MWHLLNRKIVMSSNTKALSILVILIASPAWAAIVTVPANTDFVATSIFANGGDTLNITAIGSVNLASLDGPYTTDPDGLILVGPPLGAGAYTFFLGQSVSGVIPEPGSQKFVNSLPYGSLTASISLSSAPGAFQLIGTSGSITAPAGGGYLFLRVHDINMPDNTGAFVVDVSDASVPEPTTGMAILSGLVALACYAKSSRKKETNS